MYQPFEHTIHGRDEMLLQQDIETISLKASVQKKKQGKEALLEMLVENSFDLLALLDATGTYLYVAESALNAAEGTRDSLLGYKASDFIGKNSFQFLHPDDLPQLQERFSLLFNGAKKVHIPPYRFLDAGGNWRWMEAIVTNQLDHPEIGAIVVSCRDVSQQVEREAKLKELLALEAGMEGEEKERTRIARDLHDSVANLIAATKMQLTALAENVQELRAKKEFLQSLDLLDNAAVHVRSTSHNLMSEQVVERGVGEALHQYCQSISSSKVRVNYVGVGYSRRFQARFELSLYRIVQELVGNALKHAKADSILVQLSFQEGLVSLTVEDNGQGFDAEQPSKGTGLKSVKKQVNAMLGNMELSSKKDSGTSIYLEFEM